VGDEWPQSFDRIAEGSECHDRNRVATEILLLWDVLVHREQRFEASCCGGRKQLAVPHRVPAHLGHRSHVVTACSKIAPQRARQALVEQEFHRENLVIELRFENDGAMDSGGYYALQNHPASEFQHRDCVIARDRRKVVKKLFKRVPAL
jgi:hypothetical protein